MREYRAVIDQLRGVCSNPRAQLLEAVAEGKKVVGVMPYFCPEELAYAAGMLPFGLWGAEMQANEAKRYFPAFICSLLQTTLEMGIRGELDELSAILIPSCCDSLKSMGTNWEYGVKNVPVINVAYAQNRRMQAGVDFTASQLRKIRDRLADIAGKAVSDCDIAGAIAVYNANRRALKAFADASARHTDIISPSDRSAVIKAGYFMDRAAHTSLVERLNDALAGEPACEKPKLRIVTTGIIADMPALLEIFEENGVAIVGDQIAHESVSFRELTPVTEDPIIGMAQRLGEINGCSILFDPGKKRGGQLVSLAKETNADGVIWVMAKFCDPEEFDLVPVRRMLEDAGIPMLTVEVDQQMTSYERIRSAVLAFAEMLR